MSQDDARFWMQAKVEATNKFGEQQEKLKSMNWEFWKSIVTIQATILGISVALMGYLRVNPGPLLVITWILEILSIALGFLLFKIHIDTEYRGNYVRFWNSTDLCDINISEARGEFTGAEEKRTGMLVAALMSTTPEKAQGMWTEHAKDLAKKYRGELESEKLFTEKDKIKEHARLGGISWEHQMKLATSFYVIVALSFVTLLLSILTRW